MEYSERWWKKYRRRPYKRVKMSRLLLWCKTLKDVFIEYIRHCPFDCIKNVGDEDISIKNRWAVIFKIAFTTTFTGYIFLFTWSITLDKPLVVTMESSTYNISDIDFPAVAVCSTNILSKKAVAAIARERLSNYTGHRYDKALEELETKYLQMGRLLDFTWNETIQAKFKMEAQDVFGIFTDNKYRANIPNFMKDVAPKCNEILLRCMWAGKAKKCSELFVVRRTARGHCCVFNSVRDFNVGGRPSKPVGQPKRQLEPGPINGLLVYLDPLIKDYYYTIQPINGFDILIFDPKQYADPNSGKVVHRILESNKGVYIGLNSIKQVAAKEVRKYSWNTRKCLFEDEMPELYNNLYSYSACILDCKIRTILELCKCVPYFFPVHGSDNNICNLDELRCLNKYREKLMYMFPLDAKTTEGLEVEYQDSLFCPLCLPNCEFTKHLTTALKLPLHTYHTHTIKQVTRNLGKGLNLTDKCILSVYQGTSDGTLDRLDVVTYWFEILSNTGGLVGFVLGITIITVIEFFYIFCIHFFKLLRINSNLYR